MNARFNLCLVAAITLAGGLEAQAKEPSGWSYRTMAVSLPLISMSRDAMAQIEFNLSGKASIGLYGSFMSEDEDMTQKQIEETEESLISKGREAGLMISRYSDSMKLGGFYWGLGVGYRTVEATWQVRPEEDDPEVDFSLVNDGKLNHEVTLQGVTGHGRLGYRYVADEWPFAVGAFIGLRHFQAGVKDTYEEDDEERAEGISNVTGEEKAKLRRRYKTRLLPGIALGLAF